MNFDFGIVGGGVIGLMLARQLSTEGYSVAIFERNSQLAGEASQAGGGIISPLHPWRYSEAMLHLARWSHQQYPAIARELSFSTVSYVPIINTGMLVPGIQEAEQALACNFLEAQQIGKNAVSHIEPGLANPGDSVWVPEVNNIRNPSLCLALIEDVKSRGVHSFLNVELENVQAYSSNVDLTTKANQLFSVAKLVFASGAWTSRLIERFFSSLVTVNLPEIYPVKGQMMAIKSHVGTLRSVILKDHHYLIPRHDGIVLVGSTVEYAGFDRTLTKHAHDELSDFAYQTIPALEKCRIVSQWSGFRPGSDRDAPIVSALPNIPNVYISSGHFRNGLLSAPASAQLMTDILLDRKSMFERQAYSL